MKRTAKLNTPLSSLFSLPILPTRLCSWMRTSISFWFTAIAALTTKTNKVGSVGSTEGGYSARYVRSFVKALAGTKPEVQYVLSWTGGFICTYSENVELLPEKVKTADQATMDTMIATPKTNQLFLDCPNFCGSPF